MQTKIKNYIFAVLIIAFIFISWVGFNELVGAATIFTTPATSTIDEFRVNVNSSTQNLNDAIGTVNITFSTSGDANIRIASSSNTWTFSQPTSTASINGYLSSADWVTFGAKITTTSLSVISPLSYNNTTGVFSIPTSTASQNGFLLSADWTNFASKATSTLTLTAGNGLSGGGNLTADRTFTVNTSSGISLTGDAVTLNMAGGTCSGTDKISSLSATGTVVCTTDTSGGGGGGGNFSEVWSPGSFDLATTSFAAFNKVFGTNLVYTVLDFDSTAQENAYRSTVIPRYVGTVGTSSIDTYWTAGSGTGTFTPAFTYRCVTDDEVFDATATPNTRTVSSTDTLIATGDLHWTNATATAADFAAGDICWFQMYRDVAVDTLNADARVIRVELNIQW